VHIGPELAKQKINLQEAIKPLRLIQFIQLYCSAECKVIRHTQNPVRIGIVPITAVVPLNSDELFDRFSAISKPQGPLFRRAVWTAFIKPIEPNKKRYLRTDAVEVSFQETASVPPSDGQYVELTPAEVFSQFDGSEVSKARVADAIKEWASRNNIHEDAVIVKSLVPSDELPKRSQLLDFIASLNDDELKRINLPLDIVKKFIG
jgi:hypothetical protein